MAQRSKAKMVTFVTKNRNQNAIFERKTLAEKLVFVHDGL